jgi:hypothetical protein
MEFLGQNYDDECGLPYQNDTYPEQPTVSNILTLMKIKY